MDLVLTPIPSHNRIEATPAVTEDSLLRRFRWRAHHVRCWRGVAWAGRAPVRIGWQARRSHRRSTQSVADLPIRSAVSCARAFSPSPAVMKMRTISIICARTRLQARLRALARYGGGPVLAPHHVALGECAGFARNSEAERHPHRFLLRQLRHAPASRHTRYRRYLRCRAWSSAALVVQRALR